MYFGTISDKHMKLKGGRLHFAHRTIRLKGTEVKEFLDWLDGRLRTAVDKFKEGLPK